MIADFSVQCVQTLLTLISCKFPTFAIFGLCGAFMVLLTTFVHEVALQTKLGLVLLVFKLFHSWLSFCHGVFFILCFFSSYFIICITLFRLVAAVNVLFTIILEHVNTENNL